MRILLIEDYQECAEGFFCLMEAYIPEASIVHCMTLQAAADAIEQDGPFNVIVLDLSLPDAKGTEGLQRLRQLLRETTATPIVVYTAYPQYQQECLDAGAQAFCIKASIDGHDLAVLLERIANSG